MAQKDLVFVLDIGTRNVVGTVGYQEGEGFHVVAQTIREHDTRAMLDGQIHDIGRVGKTCDDVKKELERQVEMPLTEVCIAAAGRVLRTVTTHVRMEYPAESVVVGEDLHTLDMMGIEQAGKELKEDENAKYKFYCVGYSTVKYYLNDEVFGSLEDHKATSIADDISGNEGIVIGEKTIVSYINALRQIFVIEDSKAWNPNLRSKTAIRTTDTRYFVDPSVGIAAMGLSPKDLINDMNTFGFFFENLVVRDLRVYAELMGGKVEHYRDKNNLECDIVVRLPNGKYGLIEVKLGSDKGIQEGIASLSVLSRLLDMKSMPAFRAILTATGRFAYQREDGIYIIPFGCLRP